jgi:hypothetical protein
VRFDRYADRAFATTTASRSVVFGGASSIPGPGGFFELMPPEGSGPGRHTRDRAGLGVVQVGHKGGVGIEAVGAFARFDQGGQVCDVLLELTVEVVESRASPLGSFSGLRKDPQHHFS